MRRCEKIAEMLLERSARRSSPARSSPRATPSPRRPSSPSCSAPAVYQSSVPYSAQFPTAHPAFMGALTRQQKQVRATLEPYDLLLCLGADLLRMSVYSPLEPLPANLPVIHISERAHELGKNYRTDLAVQADVKQTLLSPAASPARKSRPARRRSRPGLQS